MNNLKTKLVNDKRYKEAIEDAMNRPHVFIAPTNYCNLSCFYCSTKNIRNKKVNICLDLIKNIVDQCIENQWSFSFGQTYEPFLHPNITKIITYVHDNGGPFCSATNALAIPRDAYDLPMDLLISYSADEHDFKFRNTKLGYDIYQKRILDFVRYRINNDVPGIISLQIADYSIFNGDLTYGKDIQEVEQIFAKSRKVMKQLLIDRNVDNLNWRQKISQRKPLKLYVSGDTHIQVIPTKITPNSYDAFTELPDIDEHKGYCDSCFTMMSIQANGDVAICCCDPSAKVIAGTISPDTDIKKFWYGKEMSDVRNCFINFRPKHSFCVQCLHNVSEKLSLCLLLEIPEKLLKYCIVMVLKMTSPGSSFQSRDRDQRRCRQIQIFSTYGLLVGDIQFITFSLFQLAQSILGRFIGWIVFKYGLISLLCGVFVSLF